MTSNDMTSTPHEPQLSSGGASRADRLASFDIDAMPVPTGREEEWRFTPMRRVEGFFDLENYASDDAPVHVEAPSPVSVEVASRGDERLGTVLAPSDKMSVVAWNAFTDSTVISVPKGAVIAQPIRLLVDAAQGQQAQHVRIDVGELAEATVILTHLGSKDATLNQTLEVSVGDAAKVTLVSIQEWDDTTRHASNHRLALGKDAQLTHIVVTFGGDIVRISSDTDFRGQGGQLNMLGLYFVDAGQHLEHRVFVDHSQPNCFSRVTYKGALQGEDAHSVWIGDCLIRENADGTDTYELNRNLVLTEGAEADSVPNLEIKNGEIAGAGHASATGRFDDEQLFYLMSRGVSEIDARRLVVRGFFAELVNQIGVPEVVSHLMDAVEKELSRAQS